MHTILVADDSSTVRNVVAHAFRGSGVAVLEATSGEEALELARRERPDLVLCDVLMAGMNGYEVVEALGRDAATARIPVLLLTGPFEPFDEERARRVGAVGYLAKPFEPRALVERVRDLLGQPPGADAPASPPPPSPSEPIAAAPPASRPPDPPPDGPLALGEQESDESRAPAVPRGRVPLPGDVDFDPGADLVPAAQAEPAPDGRDLRAEVRRLVEELAPGIVREVAWEVVPEMVERLLREAGPAGPGSSRSPGDDER